MTILLIDEPAPGVRRLRINRPEARNAIDAETRAALITAITDAERDDAVGALLFGSANGMFCAGGDLPSMVGLSEAAADARLREAHTIAAAVGYFPKPVVAAVERFAIGAGAGLALLADQLIMAEGAILGFPFLRIGLTPDWGITHTLPERIGIPGARRILRSAGEIAASEALALGAADEVVPVADLERSSIERATTLAALPRAAFGRLKARLRGKDLQAALDAERLAQVVALTGPEFREGFAAFREKRRPDFQGSRSSAA